MDNRDLDHARWTQLQSRDPKADGKFWYAVRTTGIFCRPICTSRRPNRHNTTFFDSIDAAKAAGFRPCQRCNPEGITTATANALLIEKICRLIDMAESPPTLAEMAESVDLSPTYLHRLFKTVTGLKPRDYILARRAARLQIALPQENTITRAAYAAGFASNSRFYAQASELLGMTPRQYRQGGARETLRYAISHGALGAILVASSEKGVVAILLGDEPVMLLRDLQDRFPKADLRGDDPDYAASVAQAIRLVDTPASCIDLSLDIRGTIFQHRVWQALRHIPAGKTTTYAEIARAIDAPKAVRAVAGACAANPLAIAVPCHRVVRHDGALSGYRWGIERKRQLLVMEEAALSSDGEKAVMPYRLQTP